jgi:hypothetical protein
MMHRDEANLSCEGKSTCRVATFGPHPLSYACEYLADPVVRAELKRFNDLWIEKDRSVFAADYERAAHLLDQQLELRDRLREYLVRHHPEILRYRRD